MNIPLSLPVVLNMSSTYSSASDTHTHTITIITNQFQTLHQLTGWQARRRNKNLLCGDKFWGTFSWTQHPGRKPRLYFVNSPHFEFEAQPHSAPVLAVRLAGNDLCKYINIILYDNTSSSVIPPCWRYALPVVWFASSLQKAESSVEKANLVDEEERLKLSSFHMSHIMVVRWPGRAFVFTRVMFIRGQTLLVWPSRGLAEMSR